MDCLGRLSGIWKTNLNHVLCYVHDCLEHLYEIWTNYLNHLMLCTWIVLYVYPGYGKTTLMTYDAMFMICLGRLSGIWKYYLNHV